MGIGHQLAGPSALSAGRVARSRGSRAGADGHPAPVPSTIEDPAVLDALRTVLRPGS
jgi:propionyl-CoA synthetase